MCGINGIVSSRSIPALKDRLGRMNKSIAHRGPDADGIELISDGICFGHRRLSIIDLDKRSSQPMKSNGNNSLIVFNGEIFNYLQIRELLKNEYSFKTNSDTEVLLAAFETKGIDWLVSNINGMFAFAIYDRKDDSLYLVRDRFGIKPLFYTITDDALIFSSEIKGILNSGLVDAKLNVKAIDDYLAYRYVREPFTFFENIYQLNSSSYKHFQNGLDAETITYWNLPSLNFEHDFNEEEIIKDTRNEVIAAINRWKISDVKVGAYLSGGLDSSLTTAILSQNSSLNIDTYTIGFKDKGFNEFEFARVVSEKYKTNHREFLIDERDYMDEWVRLIEFKDAPLAVPNEIPLAIMTTNLSKDITVVISGEGADELFGGYGKIFRSAFDFKHQNHKDTDFYSFFIDKYEYVPRSLRDKYLQENKNYRNYFDELISSDFRSVKNEEAIFRFFHTYHIKGLLNRVDMTTMQASIEARPPFLDHKLIEYVYQCVPYDLKLKWNDIESMNKAKEMTSSSYSEVLDIPKYILKKVAEDFLPNEIIYRKKVGFPVPLTNWFPQLVNIANSNLKDTNWLRSHVIDELTNEIRNSHSEKAGQLLWMFLNIEIFIKKYFNVNWRW